MSHSFAISVPVGAWHPFLPSCLASLVAQDVRLQVSLLDASGDPRVSDLANRYDGFIHYRRHGPDDGQAAAIAEGWAKTSGDVLGWLNADDILAPCALKKALAAFECDPSLAMVSGHSTILDQQGRMTGYHWEVEPPGPRIFEANIISQPSCFFKRAACDAVGSLDPNLHYTMDWDLWIRLQQNGAKAGFIDAPLSMVMWGDQTKTISWNARRREELRRIIDNYAPADKRRRIYRAFAVHNLISRIGSPAFARILDRNKRSIFGVGVDGSIYHNAKLFLAHFENAPRAGVTIEFTGGAEDIEVETSEPARRRIVSARAIEIDFDKPIRSSHEVVLAIKASPAARAHFRFAQWR